MERLSIDEVIEHCNKTCDITEICCRCGKKFSFTAHSKNFGIRD